MAAFGPASIVPARDTVSLELTPVVIASIPNKLASQLIKQMCAAWPLPGLKHLKRVRRPPEPAAQTLDILLCGHADLLHAPPEPTTSAAPPAATPCATELLPHALAQLVAEHQLQPLLLHVPLHPPDTREQWAAWGKLWPITWKIPDPTAHVPPVSSEDQHYFEQHMAAVVSLAAQHASSSAAAIVDPATQCVVAQAVNNCHHPLDHAAMVAIRAAAERDRELWPAAAAVAADAPSGAGTPPLPTTAAIADLQPGGPVGTAADASDAAAHQRGPSAFSQPLRHDRGVVEAELPGPSAADQRAGNSSSACKRPRLEAGERGVIPAPLGEGPGPQERDGCSEASEGPPASVAGVSASGERPYMCTGYDVFLLREPCIMCAMALVHSRLQRVVYCRRDARHGALGGSCRLHSHRSLNHHYQVVHLPLLGEAADDGALG